MPISWKSNSRPRWKHCCARQKPRTKPICLTGWISQKIWRVVKSALPRLPEPKPRSNTGPPIARLRSKLTTRRGAPSAMPRSRTRARRRAANHPSRLNPAPGQGPSQPDRRKHPGSCPPPAGCFAQGDNAQASVEVDTMLIVGRHLSQHPNDKLEI